MKIKDIVKEDDFGKIANVDTANKKVTIEKPDGTKMDVPNTAVMPDPTHPGQATIDQSATAAELKPGEVVTTQATSEGNDEEVAIGGDATDDFISDVSVKPHVPGSYEAEDTLSAPAATQPATDTDGPGVGIDSAQGFRDAIKQGVGSSDPAIAAQVDKLVVAEPDGTVDVDQTMYNMVKVMDSEVLPQLLQFHKDMITMFTKFSNSPEFAQASPADQASVLQSIKDLQASLPATEKAVADSHTQFQQNEPMMQQNIKDRKMNQQLKGTPAPMSESDKALLEKMRMIAGLA